jgi:MFS family permease
VSAAPSRARVAGTVTYVSQGVCFAALVTRIPTIQDRFGLDEGALALLLGLVPIIAGVGSVVAGPVIARRSAATTLRIVGPLTPLAIVAVGLSTASGSLPLLIAALVFVGFALGSVDAAMNAHAARVEAAYGRSIMASFFAAFSLAGIIGAGLAALAASTSLALWAFFALLAVVLVPAHLIAGPSYLRGRAEPADPTTKAAGPSVHVPWRPIVIIGIALACVYIADSAASNWSAVYLTDALTSSETIAALAYACYALTTLVARVFVDRGVMAGGPVMLVRFGGLIAAGAAALIAVAPNSTWALVGFGILGFGAAPIIPLAFTAAAQHDPAGSGVAISRVNVFNYVGFVVGAPLIGLVADATSLRWAFAVLIPVLVVVAALAPAFRVRDYARG